MELRSFKKDERALEASAVDNNGRMGIETEKEENEVAETSLGENNKENQKFGEALMDKNKQEEKASKTLMEESKRECEKVEGSSVPASSEAESSEKKTPRGLKAKTKMVKTRVKKLVKRKSVKGTTVQEVDEENETVPQGTKEGMELDSTVESDKEDKVVAEASPGESDKEVKEVIDVEGSVAAPESSARDEKGTESSLGRSAKEANKVVEDSAEAPASSAKDEKDAEASVEAESSEKKTPKGLKARTKIVKTRARRLVKVKDLKGTPSVQGTNKENETMLQGTKEGMELDSAVANNKEDDKDAEASNGGNMKEVGKVTEGYAEGPENPGSAEKKTAKRLKAKAKIGKTPAKQPLKTKINKGAPGIQENAQEKNNSLLDGNKEGKSIGKMNDTELNTGEGCQPKSVDKLSEKNKQNQSAAKKTGLTEDGKQKERKQGRRGLDRNKKLKKEPAATDMGQQKEHGGSERVPECKEKPVDPQEREANEKNKKEKLGGLIFMCNARTKPDCFRYRLMGVSEKKKNLVMGIKPGLKLFLYDYDLKLLYGIFQASSSGGMKLERKAFDGSFPAQVRFKVIKDCNPLPESQFRKAIKENYNNKNKFKTELTLKQVFKLKKLFRPATGPSTTQLTHTQPISVTRDADRKRSDSKKFDKDLYGPSSSRTHSNHKRERDHHPRVSPPQRREETRDLYLSEREYRAYGLKRGERSQHYSIPPDSHHRDPVLGRVALDSYHRGLDRDRIPRHTDIERQERRDPLHSNHRYLTEREYRSYDHLNPRRELLASVPQNPPISAVALDPYERDPYYSCDYRAPVPERPSGAYLPSTGREDGMYSRYATGDSLAECYQSRRYQGVDDAELPSSSVASRYTFTGQSYSYR